MYFGQVEVPKETYDKLETVVITMNAEGINSKNELIRYLCLLLNHEVPQKERVEALQNEYNIRIDDALMEDLSKMCNYSDAILKIGEDKGRKEGGVEMLKELVKDGILSIKEAARRANLSEEYFRNDMEVQTSKEL